jgi:CheY-like chemotaxis protein
LRCSDGSTAPLITQEPGWGSPSASGSSNGPVGGSGWNPSQDKAQSSSLRSPLERGAEIGSGVQPAWILLVEDNPADIDLIKEALRHHQIDHALTILPDGEQAIALIEQLDADRAPLPDIVLLDLKLPKRGGFDVLQRMRSSRRWPAVAVMVLTSSNAQEDKRRSSLLGAMEYIVKPHLFEEFLKIGGIVKDALLGSDRLGERRTPDV